MKRRRPLLGLLALSSLLGALAVAPAHCSLAGEADRASCSTVFGWPSPLP